MRQAEGDGRWGCQGWKQRCQSYREHSQTSPVLLYHTWKLLWNLLWGPIIFSFLFCSCFIHVQNCFSMTQLYAIFFAQGHPCERCGSPESAGTSEKMWHYSLGHQGNDLSALQPEHSLLPVAFEEDLLKQGDADGDRLHTGTLGWRVEKEDLQEAWQSFTCCRQSVSAALAFYLTYPEDVHICSHYAQDFGWVKKSSRDLKLSSCRHYLSHWVISRISVFLNTKPLETAPLLHHISSVPSKYTEDWGLRATSKPISRSVLHHPN